MNFKAKVGPVPGGTLTVMGFSWLPGRCSGSAANTNAAPDQVAEDADAPRAPSSADTVAQS